MSQTVEEAKMVGMARFELATFCPPDKRANQAALHPDRLGCNLTPISEKSSRIQLFFSRFFSDIVLGGCSRDLEKGRRSVNNCKKKLFSMEKTFAFRGKIVYNT